MTLYLIGIGLCDEKDITVKGLEIIKKCDIVYLENYTSLLQCTVEDLETFYNKKITLADRSTSEEGDEKIINQAKTQEVAFLVIGDPLSATTHADLFKLAKENNVQVQTIHNASVFTAVADTGLQLYKFGRTPSIPFLDDFPQLETPYIIYKQNQEFGLHTLFLLDIKTDTNRFMTVKQAIETLEDIEKRKQENLIKEDLLAVGCARLGTPTQKIVSGSLKKLKEIDFGPPPHCFIIPGKLHFMEEEMLDLYK